MKKKSRASRRKALEDQMEEVGYHIMNLEDEYDELSKKLERFDKRTAYLKKKAKKAKK